jgi:mono/diheme cytochrome c family protein
MKSISSPVVSSLAGIGLAFAGCAPVPAGGPAAASPFEQVRPVLEASCVHCHGSQRLPGMPSFASTRDLAVLTGPGKLIVPGAPERSRFFQVVAFSDDEIGAMPPTGHGLSPREVALLRSWIADGAELPEKNRNLKPRGESPRSR